MPAPPRHQLAIVILTGDANALAAKLVAAGLLTPSMLPGPTELVVGGFLRARVVTHLGEQFLSSGQGGFRVYCPAALGPGGTPARLSNTTAAFVGALTRWRAGGPRKMDCGCGANHDLADLHFRPACGFAREWIELLDVGCADLSQAALDVLDGAPILLRRG